MIHVSALRMLILTVTSWLDRQEREMLAYLIEENRVLRRQVGAQRMPLSPTMTGGNSQPSWASPTGHQGEVARGLGPS